MIVLERKKIKDYKKSAMKDDSVVTEKEKLEKSMKIKKKDLQIMFGKEKRYTKILRLLSTVFLQINYSIRNYM